MSPKWTYWVLTSCLWTVQTKVKDQRASDNKTQLTLVVHGSQNSILFTVRTTSNIIYYKNYSNLDRLLRVTVIVLKFVHLLKSIFQWRDVSTTPEVTSLDIERAQSLQIKELQDEMKENKKYAS